jgi:hypothetical protein
MAGYAVFSNASAAKMPDIIAAPAVARKSRLAGEPVSLPPASHFRTP